MINKQRVMRQYFIITVCCITQAIFGSEMAQPREEASIIVWRDEKCEGEPLAIFHNSDDVKKMYESLTKMHKLYDEKSFDLAPIADGAYKSNYKYGKEIPQVLFSECVAALIRYSHSKIIDDTNVHLMQLQSLMQLKCLDVNHSSYNYLIRAVRANNPILVKLLLTHPNIDVNQLDSKGENALFLNAHRLRRSRIFKDLYPPQESTKDIYKMLKAHGATMPPSKTKTLTASQLAAAAVSDQK